MKEKWKDIPGYEGLYQISNLGRVKSLKFGRNAIMRLTTNKGYKTIGLSFRTKKDRKKHGVHRLVALAFIPNPKRKRIVHHKDGNTANNRVDNLEWATDKENSAGAGTKSIKTKILLYIARSGANTLSQLLAYINRV